MSALLAHPPGGADRSRDLRVMSLERLVLQTAVHMSVRLPPGLRATVLPDFIQVAWLGAIGAVDNYDPARGEFSWYARQCISHRLQDYMRSVDHLSKSNRQSVKTGECEPPRRIPVSIRWPSPESFDQAFITRHDLARLIKTTPLSKRCLVVLRKYYWGGETMERIADTLSITKGRVSQIHTELIRLLRITATHTN